jgi:hypothetical protein
MGPEMGPGPAFCITFHIVKRLKYLDALSPHPYTFIIAQLKLISLQKETRGPGPAFCITFCNHNKFKELWIPEAK